MQDYGAHPPFAHNPHVYGGIDPDAARSHAVAVDEHESGDTMVVDVESSEDANVDVDGDGQVDGYEVFTKAELIAECEGRRLPTTGNKPDLVKRLQDADKAEAEEVAGGE